MGTYSIDWLGVSLAWSDALESFFFPSIVEELRFEIELAIKKGRVNACEYYREIKGKKEYGEDRVGWKFNERGSNFTKFDCQLPNCPAGKFPRVAAEPVDSGAGCGMKLRNKCCCLEIVPRCVT